jgi:cyclase
MTQKGHGIFRIEELVDGVFAIVADQDGLRHSNAGIIDLGEETLVLDTLTLPSYGATLAAACRDLTGRDPSWVALTHCHADHGLGNQAFPSTTPLVATHTMLPLIEERMAEYQQAIDEPASFAREMEHLAATCEAAEDSTRRAAIQTNLARYRALYDGIGALCLVRPNTLFEGTTRLVGSKRAVELIEVPDAHTARDVYLRLPDEGILFMGDLGSFGTIPFLAYADPPRWPETLRAFEDSEIRTYVPGHGVVGTVDRVTREGGVHRRGRRRGSRGACRKGRGPRSARRATPRAVPSAVGHGPAQRDELPSGRKLTRS